MVLTDKQKNELHQAVLDYFVSSGLKGSAAVFQKEAKIEPDPLPKISGSLERKWTIVLKLQKNVMELERENEKLRSQLGLPSSSSLEGSRKTHTDISKKIVGKINSRGYPKSTLPLSITMEHKESVTSVCFHPVKHVLVSGSTDYSVGVWEYESGARIRELKSHEDSVNSVVFDDTGSILASCSNDQTVKLWNTDNDYELVHTLKGHNGEVSSVCFLPGGDLLISCSRDGEIRLWETETGYCKKTMNGHTDWVKCVAVSSDGQTIISGSADQTIRCWNTQSGKCINVLEGHNHVVESVAMSSHNFDKVMSTLLDKKISEEKGGEYLLSGGRDCTVRVWELSSGTCVLCLAHDGWVKDIQLHPCGEYFISVGEDRTMYIWDVSQGRTAKVLKNIHSGPINTISIQPVTLLVASGSDDKSIKLWRSR